MAINSPNGMNDHGFHIVHDLEPNAERIDEADAWLEARFAKVPVQNAQVRGRAAWRQTRRPPALETSRESSQAPLRR
jgi:hypothetical protein